MCVDVPRGSTQPNLRVTLQPCTGKDNQHFKIVEKA